MTKQLFIITFCLLPILSYGQLSPKWEMDAGSSLSGSFENLGRGISTDALGNCYVTGSYSGEFDFSPSVKLISSGNNNIFIAKYDKDGNLQWTKDAGGSNEDYGNSIRTDAQGNSYVTGYVNSPATFGTLTTTGSGQQMFLAKYDKNGVCKWVKTNSGTLSLCAGYGLCLDDKGGVYVVGSFAFTNTFGSFSLISAGLDDIFVAKYDTSGNCLWAKSAGGSGTDVAKGAWYLNGHIYVSGAYNNTMIIGSTTLANAGSYDVFVAKYDLSGNVAWAKRAGGPNDDESFAIAAYGNSVYVEGYYSNNAIFGSTTYNSLNYDQFTATYDTSGAFDTVSHANTGYRGTDITVDASGNLGVSGLGAHPIKAGAYSEAICYDNAGNLFSTGQYFDGVAGRWVYVQKYSKNTGVNKIETTADVIIYPNPSDGLIKIESGKSEIKEIIILNQLGQCVYRGLPKDKTYVDFRALPSGMYVLNLRLESKTIVRKLFIKK